MALELSESNSRNYFFPPRTLPTEARVLVVTLLTLALLDDEVELPLPVDEELAPTFDEVL